MELSFEYTKQRKLFGLPFQFSNSPVQLLHSIEPSKKEQANWTQRYVSSVDIDCIPDVAEMKVGTTPVELKNNGMVHTEGGWGKEVNNPQDQTERKRALERLKGATFSNSVIRMSRTVQGCVEQNNSVDMYESYFADDHADHSSEPPSARTISVLRDPNEIKRSATNICWHPDGTAKVAVSYAVMQFQKMPENMPTQSYIWDINNPNEPDYTITPPSPCCALAFNPKSPDWLVGGCYNGLIAFWDVRKHGTVETSLIENSHHDPVYDVAWIQSRTNQEMVSVSTDGHVKWWDIRKLSAPIDSFACSYQDADAKDDRRYGCISLEYRTDAGATKFLVGTESGDVLSIERKAKKDSSSQISIKQTFGGDGVGHHGPVYSVKRNPGNSKYFLSVGDWSAKVWCEDLRTPVLLSRYEPSYITAGVWSATRPGVFYTCKMDGTVDVWDIFYKQNEPVLPIKIGEVGLSSLGVHSKGKLVAVGSVDGSVSILDVCDSLAVPQQNEKVVMQQLFDRETKREKHLEQMRIKRGAGNAQAKKKAESSEIAIDEELMRKTEEEFNARLAADELGLSGNGSSSSSSSSDEVDSSADVEQ